MLKDILLGAGALAGTVLAGIGLVVLLNRPDPSTTYEGERLFDNIVGDVIGIPALIVGLLLLGICAWGLLR